MLPEEPTSRPAWFFERILLLALESQRRIIAKARSVGSSLDGVPLTVPFKHLAFSRLDNDKRLPYVFQSYNLFGHFSNDVDYHLNRFVAQHLAENIDYHAAVARLSSATNTVYRTIEGKMVALTHLGSLRSKQFHDELKSAQVDVDALEGAFSDCFARYGGDPAALCRESKKRLRKIMIERDRYVYTSTGHWTHNHIPEDSQLSTLDLLVRENVTLIDTKERGPSWRFNLQRLQFLLEGKRSGEISFGSTVSFVGYFRSALKRDESTGLLAATLGVSAYVPWRESEITVYFEESEVTRLLKGLLMVKSFVVTGILIQDYADAQRPAVLCRSLLLSDDLPPWLMPNWMDGQTG